MTNIVMEQLGNDAYLGACSGRYGDTALGNTSIWQPEVLSGVFDTNGSKSDDRPTYEGQWL